MFLKISKFFLYASVFAVVIVLSGTFFPFIGGKYYFFRVAVEAALAFFLLHWAFEDTTGEVERRVAHYRKKPLFWAVTAFVGLFLISAFTAHDVRSAFWSNFERGEGAFQMLHYYVFFVLLGFTLKTERDWRWMFRSSLLATVCMLGYGVFAAGLVSGFVGPYTGIAQLPGSNFWNRLFSDQRFQGSLGNPAYVAPYLIFASFYALYLWLSKKAAWEWERRAALILIPFFALFFLLSQTRGAFLGFLCALGVFFVALGLGMPRLRKQIGGVFVLSLVLFGMLFAFRSNPIIQKLPGSRILYLDFNETTAQTRFWTWNSAWNGFKDRPLFGWGPENFSTVFDKYFDTRHYAPGQNSETWFDRAHSIIFDYLAETGIFTTLAFLSIFFFYYRDIFKRFIRRAAAYEKNYSIIALLVAIPVAYFVQGLILFDVLPIYINLFLFLSFSMHYEPDQSF